MNVRLPEGPPPYEESETLMLPSGEGLRHRRVRLLTGLILLGGLLIQCERALNDKSAEALPVVVKGPVKAAFAALVPAEPGGLETLEQRAARDPIAFFDEAIKEYDRTVRDYTCTFTKQELIGGQLTEEQVIRAMFREDPFSVCLEWVRNADKAARALYVADRWVEDGQQRAVVDPAGAIASLLVSHVMRPIHGADAKKSSRRTIDQFGLRNAMSLIVKYGKQARDKGVLDLRYMGNGEVDGRETLVFDRRLPYTGDETVWPDRVLVVHVDKKLLVPVLCISYADDAKKELLGRYMTTDIELNVNHADSVFTKEGMGL